MGDKDDRVSLEGLDPVKALKALLAVDPEAQAADERDDEQAPEPPKRDDD